MKAFLLAFLMVTPAAQGKTSMQAEKPAITPRPLSCHYEGNADAGRIVIDVDEQGKARAAFDRHPMVITKSKPWTKSVQLPPADVAPLLSLLRSEPVRKTRIPPFDFMPGMDVVEKLIRVDGEKDLRYELRFVEAPEALAPALAELKKIYDRIKAAR